jgi:hypothetical protein
VRCTKTSSVKPSSAPYWSGIDAPKTSRAPCASSPETWRLATALASWLPRSIVLAGSAADASVVELPCESTAVTSSVVGAGSREKVSVSPPVTRAIVPFACCEHAAARTASAAAVGARPGRTALLLARLGAAAPGC